MLRKITALLLALTLLLSLGISCAETTAPFDPAAVSGEITFWTAWAEDAGVGDWIAAFNEKYPNIKVTPVQYANNTEGNLKVNASLMGNEEIDVVLNFTYANYLKRASEGLFLDVTDYVKGFGVDSVSEWGYDFASEDGLYFGLPVGGNTDKIWVNMDMVEAAGLTLPESWTLEEYIDFARALTKGEGETKVYGTSDMHSGQLYWSRMARGALGSNYYYTEDGHANLSNQAFIDSMQLKYQLETVEGIQYPYLEYLASGMQATDAFINGKVAMTVCTGMMARWLRDTGKYPRDFKVAVMEMPALYDDAEANYNDGVYYFSFLGIGKGCKYPEAAWVFMNWFATEGSKGLATVGHVPLWKNADKDAVIEVMFGENAAETMDIDSVKRKLLNFEGKTYIDTVQTAYSEIETIAKSYVEFVMTGEMTAEQACQTMNEEAEAAIQSAN